eukprot:9541115-Karenia_brevis.AAC.1
MTGKATAAPLVRWAAEVWNTTGGWDKRRLAIQELRDTWHDITNSSARPDTWKQVRGPVGAALMSAQRIGWSLQSPFEWTTDSGYKLHLAQEAPALIEWHVHRSAQRMIERRVAMQTRDPELEGRRANLTFIKRLLQSKSQQA